MSSVLFDALGPKAKRRNTIIGVIAVIAIVGFVAFVIYQFAVTGQFNARKWVLFSSPVVQRTILSGLGATLSAFIAAAVGSLILGFILAVGRLSDHKWVSLPVGWFTELFRAVPVLILMALVYYGLPSVGVPGITPYLAVVSGLILYNGSVLAEIFRAGIEAVPRGQSEAAYAIGMRKTQVMVTILMPQAFRSMLPVIIGQLVVALKDTALGFIITYQELLRVINNLGGQVAYQTPYIPAAIIGGALYVGCCLVLSLIAKIVERRLARGRKPKAAPSTSTATAGTTKP